MARSRAVVGRPLAHEGRQSLMPTKSRVGQLRLEVRLAEALVGTCRSTSAEGLAPKEPRLNDVGSNEVVVDVFGSGQRRYRTGRAGEIHLLPGLSGLSRTAGMRLCTSRCRRDATARTGATAVHSTNYHRGNLQVVDRRTYASRDWAHGLNDWRAGSS